MTPGALWRLHYAGMSVVRPLPAFLLSVLRRQAAVSRNRQLLAEIEEDLRAAGGAGSDAPDATELLAQARDEHVAEDDDWARRERD
jgi:hypothetical protein